MTSISPKSDFHSAVSADCEKLRYKVVMIAAARELVSASLKVSVNTAPLARDDSIHPHRHGITNEVSDQYSRASLAVPLAGLPAART
jgi:hypothetical protein